jgi:hypothetical protein
MLAPILTRASNYKFPSDGKGLQLIEATQIMETISIFVIILFAAANIILPFINKQLSRKEAEIKNLLI